MKSERVVTALLLLPSALVLFNLAFEWTLIGWLTPFLYPEFLFATWCLLAVASLAALVRLFWKKAYRKWQNYLPLLATTVVLLLALYFPFTDVWLKANFVLFRHVRESIAADFLAGKYSSSTDQRGDFHLHGLLAGEISEDDGTVAVYRNRQELAVYFYTYRGVLGHSTGYYYIQSGSRPSETDYLHVLEHVAPRWYLVQTE